METKKSLEVDRILLFRFSLSLKANSLEKYLNNGALCSADTDKIWLDRKKELAVFYTHIDNLEPCG